ncbi:type I restriction enzyme HsdR N-terminal domain-containing protein [Bacillus sp. ISL-7]|uniref:type I restriction enzyme HsdR N-terminal domain-containing protein n=1 Tax=Bacillus sp. ISL-7 TaxID=2819136 RepID=UPI001BEC0232|nr:type I restriction enzyme HsdR N-terminal domain-containing protein [Bacillus sp. ISL-7]MBT2736193.1 type I restriction enzyme HsdR N-terminal domain-containing protein [Bacillus sp. ISL-7]
MKTYKSKTKKLLYCPCRQIFLHYTPEEEVRQNLLQYLIHDMEIPADSISTEFPLNRIDPRSRKRADIVVWNRDRDGHEYPLLVLELKAEHIELTDQTLQQVKSYNDILKAKYIGISNGSYVHLYEVTEMGILPLTDDFYTYSQLLVGKVEYSKFRRLNRLSYQLTTYDRYVNHLLNIGYIGEGTSKEMHPFISELQNFILCEQIQPNYRYKTFIVEDLSNGRFAYGNASGGNFPGYYRSFIVNDLDGNHAIYRIGIFGTNILVNDPVYGNRNGNTYLNVAIDESGTSSNILQLNIDRFFKYDILKDSYDVTHNGRRNGYKNAEVLENVQKYAPDLIMEGNIYIGTLPANKSITTNDASDFIERLLMYANIREKLNQKGKKKRKGK